MRTLLTTSLAMVAFAANSVLTRLALDPADIDAASFTGLRLASGAVTLLVIARARGRRRTPVDRGDWTSAAALFAYAALFSFAYLELPAGTGALILFALVQVTMISWGIARGERPRPRQWIGILLALGGLAHLVSPGMAAPSPFGTVAMAGAGVAWGVYSLRGRAPGDPVVRTTDNFVRSVPMVGVLVVVALSGIDVEPRGVLLAVASGSLASGLGYVIWFDALRGLTATRAAAVQLTVPVIAAVGGLLFLGEAFTLRLLIAAVLILGGVGATLSARSRVAAPRDPAKK
jgi:drug/metabolite transporter (DMT)-like permease